MSIQVTPIPRLTTLTTPAFTLGTTNAAGDAITAVASNSTLLTFDTTLPAATGTAAVGSATVAPRRDHVHASTEAATQAEQESASSTSVYVSPGRQQFHPSAAKAWASIHDGGSTLQSYNCDSTAKSATGVYTVTITNNMSATTYCGIAATMDSANAYPANVNTRAVGSYKVNTYNSSGTAADITNSSAIFGDL